MQPVQRLLVAGQLHALHLLQIKDEDVQSSLGGDARILLAQRTGGSIARIFKRLFFVEFLLSNHLFKALDRHIHLAAHLQIFHRLC